MTNNPSPLAPWEEALDRFMEGLCPASEVSALLMRIDLPDEGRAAIHDAVALVDGLSQSLRPLPVPAGALARLLDRLGRQQPRTGAEPSSRSAGGDQSDDAADGSADLPAEEEVDADELRALAGGLDCAFADIAIPSAAQGRLLRALAAQEDRDVTAGFDLESTPAESPASQSPAGEDISMRMADYVRAHGHDRDVLAAQKDAPPDARAGDDHPPTDEPRA